VLPFVKTKASMVAFLPTKNSQPFQKLFTFIWAKNKTHWHHSQRGMTFALDKTTDNKT
jgi:hypothetical protein